MAITWVCFQAARTSWTGKLRTETALLLDKAGKPPEKQAPTVTNNLKTQNLK